MKRIFSVLLVTFTLMMHSQTVLSPSKKIALDFKLTADGIPTYSVSYNKKAVILESQLGVKLKGTADLASSFSVDSTRNVTFNESWKPVLGEQSSINNHYNELTVSL